MHELGPDEERVLVGKAQNGDEAALERLLELNQDRVFRTALGLMGGNQEAAFEVAQEVLISAYRHIGQFAGKGRLSTWLYRMTVNFSKNHKVSSGRRRARFVSMDAPVSDVDDAQVRQFPVSAPSASELAAGSEMLDILRERLGSLAEEFRSVLVLRYFEDRSYEEIAEALELPIGTVKSRINRGRQELRKLMGDVLAEGGMA